jgi:hypothetical protein
MKFFMQDVLNLMKLELILKNIIKKLIKLLSLKKKIQKLKKLVAVVEIFIFI